MSENNSTVNPDLGDQSTVKSAVQPTPGESITSLATGNTYIIGEEIGEGAFGIVYSCRDVWENELAVKVLKPHGSYERVRGSAESELKKLVELRNPFITFVYDAFEFRDTFYIVTERCHFSIPAIFAIQKYNGITWIRPVARCLLQAVHFIHLNNYVHQDIHLRNVFGAFIKGEMSNPTEKPLVFKLGDLGVAKLVSEVNGQNTRAQWMLPPEVLRPNEFGPTDKRIDIYHTSLLLLQIFSGKEIQLTQEEVLSGRPRQMAESLPPPYNVALSKGLRRHASLRTETALELWRDLNLPTLRAL